MVFHDTSEATFPTTDSLYVADGVDCWASQRE